jgi:hypothetical protein
MTKPRLNAIERVSAALAKTEAGAALNVAVDGELLLEPYNLRTPEQRPLARSTIAQE